MGAALSSWGRPVRWRSPSGLQRCKCLRNFKYHSDDNVIPWNGPSSMVHDTLESLSVLNGAVSWRYPRDGLESVLKSVFLPVLRNLTIEGPPPMRQFVSNNPTQYVDARLSFVLIIFIQHSQPLHLTTLTLNSIAVDKGFLDTIVQVSGRCSALSRVELDIRHLAGDTSQGRGELAAQFIPCLLFLDLVFRRMSQQFCPDWKNLCSNSTVWPATTKLHASQLRAW